MYTDSTSKHADTGQILSQARKGQWNAQNGYNLLYTEHEESAGTTESVDLEQVDDLQAVPSEHAKFCADCHEGDILS